jgi:hypothetical protein
MAEMQVLQKPSIIFKTREPIVMILAASES